MWLCSCVLWLCNVVQVWLCRCVAAHGNRRGTDSALSSLSQLSLLSLLSHSSTKPVQSRKHPLLLQLSHPRQSHPYPPPQQLPSLAMPHAAARKPSPPAIPATVSFHPLKNCFLNLPASLVNVLVSSNTPAQNVVVELSFRTTTSNASTGTTSTSRSAYAGWTGMPSKRKPTAGTGRSEDAAVVEMDPAFARNVGLSEGSKVRAPYILHCYYTTYYSPSPGIPRY